MFTDTVIPMPKRVVSTLEVIGKLIYWLSLPLAAFCLATILLIGAEQPFIEKMYLGVIGFPAYFFLFSWTNKTKRN